MAYMVYACLYSSYFDYYDIVDKGQIKPIFRECFSNTYLMPLQHLSWKKIKISFDKIKFPSLKAENKTFQT